MKKSKPFFILYLFLFLLSSGKVNALEIESVDAQSKSGVQVSPALFEVESKKPQYQEYYVEITNYSGVDDTFTFRSVEFEPSDDPEHFYEISRNDFGEEIDFLYVTSEVDEVILKNNEKAKVLVGVAVPTSISSGEHYGALVIESQSQPYREDVLFLVYVNGERVEEGSINNFSSPTFYETPPIQLEIEMANTGNIHLKPSGKIEIKNMFGRKIGELEVEEFIILSRSERKLNLQFENEGFMTGRYTAKLSMDLGITGEELGGIIQFWVIPWKIVLVFSIISIVILFAARELIGYIMSKLRRLRK